MPPDPTLPAALLAVLQNLRRAFTAPSFATFAAVGADNSSAQLSVHMGWHVDRPIDDILERARLDLLTLSNMFKTTCSAAASNAVSPARMNSRHA